MTSTAKHVVSGRIGYGTALVLCTVLMWGLLPIGLKITLTELDIYTATWMRFIVSGVLLAAWMIWRQALPNVRGFSLSTWLWVLLACSGMLCNYIFYASSLQFLNPETAQLLIQLAPFLVLLGGVVLFKEPFSRGQKFGVVFLIVGFLVFFNKNISQLLVADSNYSLGVVLMFVAALTWAVYALIQKRLLRKMKSMDLMLMIYIMGSCVYFPLAKPQDILTMSSLPMAMLIFCCLNTLVAYGAFAESMQHLHASQVSAIITLVPIITFACMWLAVKIWPAVLEPSDMNILAYVGGGMVVVGSILAARNNSIKEGVKT
jgi:drug/metabolite transporter (DMT)-like permease